MAENKTQKTGASVKAFIDGIENDLQPKDARNIMKMMKDATGKSCLHIKKLEDVDMTVLHKLITASVRHVVKTGQPC